MSEIEHQQDSQKSATKHAPDQSEPVRGGNWKLPLIIFLAMAGFLYYALFAGDPSRLPSALVGKTVPKFDLPAIEGVVNEDGSSTGFATRDVTKGEIALVNFWASWCIPCHEEHPYLTALKQEAKVPLYGVNMKDEPKNARRFLGRYGNPYKAIGRDRSGRTAIEWGVYGAPETFIVSADGKVVYRHVGPINNQIIKEKLLPIIEQLRGKSESGS